MRPEETLNRLLLRGAARRHTRDAVFLEWRENGWEPVPDWRADRQTIRIALCLRERHGVGPGDAVGLRLPLGVTWPIVERAVWGLGAATVVGRGWAEAKATLGIEDVGELLEHGGVLDTPERASHFRALAREVPPEAVASIEEDTELTQGAWAKSVEAFLRRQPPEEGRTYLVGPSAPERAARAGIYACWSDAVSRIAFGAGTGTEGFVSLPT